jgi:hypothetical protein
VTLGMQAKRGKQVVAAAPLRTFRPKRGTIALRLERKRWPTAVSFLTDTPKVALLPIPATLGGTVTVAAKASAIEGRKVASVRFDYSATGANAWISFGTATTAPFSGTLDTSTLQSGGYDFRAVVTDSAGVAAISAVVKNRRVQGVTTTSTSTSTSARDS